MNFEVNPANRPEGAETSPRRISVLIIDNAPSDRLLLSAYLDEPPLAFNISFAASLGTGLALLDREQIDVVLLDLGLPDSQGIETYQLFQRKAPSVPIVVMTGLDDDHVAHEAVRNGAQDYLVKGQTSADGLRRAIRYAVERFQLLRRVDEDRYQRHDRREEMAWSAFPPKAEKTTQGDGKGGLKENAPSVFGEAVSLYRRALLVAHESQTKRRQHVVSPELRELADKLGVAEAGSSDLIEVHRSAVQDIMLNERSVNPAVISAEARFLILELMGYMISLYRREAKHSTKLDSVRDLQDFSQRNRTA